MVTVLDHRGIPATLDRSQIQNFGCPEKQIKENFRRRKLRRFGRPRAVVMSGPGAEFVRRAQEQRREWWGRRGTKNVELVRSYSID